MDNVTLPAWMDSIESIQAQAALLSEENLRGLLERTGGLVVGATDGRWIEDRSTGVVFMRCESPRCIGEVYRLPVRTATQDRSTLTPAIIHFRILRAVPIEEVRAMAAKWAGRDPLPVVGNFWYQVFTD